eukprot:7259357-Alexandrium_andersonii.AAC.1
MAVDVVHSPPGWRPAVARLARRSFGPLAGVAHQDPCPLCRIGEFGSENLWVWRPAVRPVLRRLGARSATEALTRVGPAAVDG